MLVRGDEPLDTTFERLLTEAPGDVRSRAQGLPYRLGLTHRPHGGWGDFASLEPICDLPLYVLDVMPRVGEETVAQFRFAHRAGGFHGLLIDRVADGQVTLDRDLRSVRTWLRRVRVAALATAIGDACEAERLVQRAERAFRAATALERRARSTGKLAVSEYVRIVSLKTAWLAGPTVALLRRGAADHLAAFERGYTLFMLGLQALDDGSDIAEDEALFGVSVPALLGVSPGAMRQAARVVTEHATSELGRAGFARFAAWSESRTRELRSPAGLLSALGGLALGERLAA
ncbi:MAG: hypothetical protein IT379_42020 [Deltaproteobacteria bacterium]|nr:hypothetical protein [Deltaproteobacteria bacterium]